MKELSGKWARGRAALIGTFVTFVLVACSTTVGTKFARPGEQEFTLGQTTYEVVVRRLGKPSKEETGSSNGKALKTINYSFVTDAVPAVHPGVVGDREQIYTFYKDILVAEAFSSTFTEDQTDFDDTKVELIKQGKTTVSEVTSILGRPGGRAIYPSTDNEDQLAVLYLYRQMRRSTGLFNFEFFTKSLAIAYGKDGVVTKVDFSQSGKR